MLIVTHPPTYIPERDYVLSVILGEFLGLEYRTRVADCLEVSITREGCADGRVLTMSDQLFQTPQEQWLTPLALPPRPIRVWNAIPDGLRERLLESSVPVLYGRQLSSGAFCVFGDTHVHLGIDIFGSSFFMLTCYEELVSSVRDSYGRFPATESLAYQVGFLHRPLINEYVEILWAALEHLWPSLRRQARRFQLRLTHDVDEAYVVRGKSLLAVARSTLADLVLRKDSQLAGNRLLSCYRVRRGDEDADLCNTFDFIMDLSEEQGVASAFYFMSACQSCYCLSDPWVSRLMRRIHERGHELGFHPDLGTFRDAQLLAQEFGRLRQTSEALGISQERWGGRHHYLQWDASVTWQAWEDAGLAYDSSVGFADQVGFRCGTCYEFPVFNVHTRQRLQLRERPLIVMEATLLGYMGLDCEEALEQALLLKRACKRFEGEFTLLWHNARLMQRRERELYRHVVEG